MLWVLCGVLRCCVVFAIFCGVVWCFAVSCCVLRCCAVSYVVVSPAYCLLSSTQHHVFINSLQLFCISLCTRRPGTVELCSPCICVVYSRPVIVCLSASNLRLMDSYYTPSLAVRLIFRRVAALLDAFLGELKYFSVFYLFTTITCNTAT